MFTKELLAKNPSLVIGLVAAFGIGVICLMEGQTALSLGAFFACGIYFSKLNEKKNFEEQSESSKASHDDDDD